MKNCTFLSQSTRYERCLLIICKANLDLRNLDARLRASAQSLQKNVDLKRKWVVLHHENVVTRTNLMKNCYDLCSKRILISNIEKGVIKLFLVECYDSFRVGKHRRKREKIWEQSERREGQDFDVEKNPRYLRMVKRQPSISLQERPWKRIGSQ